MRKLGLLALALTALIAIGLVVIVFMTRRPIDIRDYPEPTRVAQALQAQADVRLSILKTAAFSAPEGAIVEGGDWLKRREMAHSAVLICHRSGFLVFDTGLGREIDAQFQEFPLITRAMLGGYQKLQTAADVIERDDPCPGRPLTIIPSHLHWDHAGGIEDFQEVPVWVVSDELRQAREAGVSQGFLPGEIDSADIRWRPLTLTNTAYEHYAQSLDVFGDGSVVLVPMAGHTAGSLGVFVTAAGRRYFFTGDTTWALEGFTYPAHKFFAARAMADLNLDQLDAEIMGVHWLMQREPDLTVIPAHDLDAYPAEAVYPNWVGGGE